MVKVISTMTSALLLCLVAQPSAIAAPLSVPAAASIQRPMVQEVRWVTRCHRHHHHHRAGWYRTCRRVHVYG
jgi:hypothetical protein